MRIIAFYFALVVMTMFLLVGCEGSSEIQSENAKNLQNPELIGTNNAGLPLYRVAIYKANFGYHYIYYFGTNDTTTISVNYRSGKTSQVIVIGNQAYQLVPVK